MVLSLAAKNYKSRFMSLFEFRAYSSQKDNYYYYIKHTDSILSLKNELYFDLSISAEEKLILFEWLKTQVV